VADAGRGRAPTEAEGSFGSVLRNRSFLALWLAQVLSQIADNIVYFTLLVEVYRRTGSNTAVSALVLVFTVPALTFGLLAGVLVDRVDKRLVLLGSNLGRAFVGLVLVLAPNSFGALLALGFVASIFRQFFMPAEAAALPRILQSKDLLPANALFTLTYNASFIVGFAGAGPLLKFAGTETAYLISTILFGAATGLCLALPSIVPEAHNVVRRATVRAIGLIARELREGWAFLRSSRETTGTMLQLAFAWSLSGITAAVAPGYASTVLGLSEEDAFYLIFPAGCGVILGSILVGRFGRHARPHLLIAAGFVGIGLATVLLSSYRRILDLLVAQFPAAGSIDLHPGGLPGFLIVVMVLSACLGLANATTVIPANTALQHGTPDELRGRVFSVLNALGNTGSTAPILIVGIAADLIGLRYLLLGIGMSVLLVGLLSLRRSR